MNKIVVLLGPTAVGKSDIAIKIAKEFKFEIINCDSRQIYKEMEIGTGKPKAKDRELIPHHLYDVINPDKSYSAGNFVIDASEIIKNLWSNNIIPVIVGGTGFYFEALYSGLPEIPANQEIRTQIQNMYKLYGLKELVNKMAAIDPNSIKIIDTNNPNRVFRALEIMLVTSKPLSEARVRTKKLDADYLIFIIYMDRYKLKDKIYKRILEMAENGLKDEVEYLHKKYTFNAPGLKTIGYYEWKDYFENKLSEKEVIRKIFINTCQYAKRQDTWFRKRPLGPVYKLNVEDNNTLDFIFDKIKEFLKK